MDLAGLSGLSGLAAVIGALGGGVAWLVKRADGAKTAIPRAQAEIAHASASLSSSLSTVQASLTAEVERLREDRDEDRRRHADEIAAVHDATPYEVAIARVFIEVAAAHHDGALARAQVVIREVAP